MQEKKKKKRGKTISFILIARWEDRERGGELKQTIKIGETTSFDFSGFSKPREFELFQFFTSTNSKPRLLFSVLSLIFPFFNFNIFQWQSSVGEEKIEQTRYLNLKIFPSQILFRSSMHLFTERICLTSILSFCVSRY